MGRDRFLFKLQWARILRAQRAEIRLEVYDAIMEYMLSGTLSELKPQAAMAFEFIKEELDNFTKQYDKAVEAHREAGRKGGAPAGNRNASKGADQNNQKQPKQPNGYQNNQKQPKQPNGCEEKESEKERESTPLLPLLIEKEKDKEKESAASAEPPQPSVCGEEKSDNNVSPSPPHKEQDAARRFRRPTVDEVAAYVAAQGFAFSAAAFCDYYDSVGWVIGRGKPMKDWRAACHTWQQRHKEEQQQRRGAPPSPPAAAYRDPSKFVNDRWREEG